MAAALLAVAMVLALVSGAGAQDAERMAMAQVRLSTEQSAARGCSHVGTARDNSVRDLRRKIVRAGGNLAARCCHEFDARSYEPVDEHDRASCRPNFGLLIYPGYLVEKDGTLVEGFATPRRNQTPPMFVTFAVNDRLVEGAFPYVFTLREARVPVALHLYETGGHGQGLRASGYPFSRWTFTAKGAPSTVVSVSAVVDGTSRRGPSSVTSR